MGYSRISPLHRTNKVSSLSYAEGRTLLIKAAISGTGLELQAEATHPSPEAKLGLSHPRALWTSVVGILYIHVQGAVSQWPKERVGCEVCVKAVIRQVIQAKQHVPSRSCSPVSVQVCRLLGFVLHLLPGCLHLTHQRPGAATWLMVGRVQERHRGGQALLFLWTSRWEHRADEPGQEGVSILHTLNTSAEDSDMWRVAVIKSPNQVGRSRIRAG